MSTFNFCTLPSHCVCVYVSPDWSWQQLLQSTINVAVILGGMVGRSRQSSFNFHLLLASFRCSAAQQWYWDNCGVQSDWCCTVFGPSSDGGLERKWPSLPSTSAARHGDGWSGLSSKSHVHSLPICPKDNLAASGKHGFMTYKSNCH